jgi:DNA-binding response OmpR family regulator
MSKRLLILVDDEWVTTRALVLDLTEAGYRVETAEDDREVDRMARAEPYDLLIAADGRDGEEARDVVERFRRVRPAAKVVLMTTRGGGKSDGLTGELAESVTRIRKPFDLDAIRTVVNRLLEPEGTTSGKAT